MTQMGWMNLKALPSSAKLDMAGVIIWSHFKKREERGEGEKLKLWFKFNKAARVLQTPLHCGLALLVSLAGCASCRTVRYSDQILGRQTAIGITPVRIKKDFIYTPYIYLKTPQNLIDSLFDAPMAPLNIGSWIRSTFTENGKWGSPDLARD